MAINRLSTAVTPSTAKVARGSAPHPASPVGRPASDSLTLSSSADAKAIGLLRAGQALDARGLTRPALDSYAKAADEAKTLETLLAVRDAIKQRPRGWGADDLTERTLERAEELAKALPVTTLKGDAGAKAYQAHALKMDSLGLPGAAEAAYVKAVKTADTYAAAMAIVRTLDPDGPQDYFHGVRENAKDHLVELAKKAPIGGPEGEAVAQLVKRANEMYLAHLTPLADVFYQRALSAATTPESCRKIQQAASELEDLSVLEKNYEELAKDKLRRIEQPLQWWNPFTW